jgi:hypothetical protein
MDNKMTNILSIIIFLLVATGVFWLVSQGFMYNLTQKVTGLVGWTSSVDGVPNNSGVILHGVVLALLLTLTVQCCSLV